MKEDIERDCIKIDMQTDEDLLTEGQMKMYPKERQMKIYQTEREMKMYPTWMKTNVHLNERTRREWIQNKEDMFLEQAQRAEGYLSRC